MRNTFGNNISVTIFGESHGESVGAVLDGLCAGIDVNEDEIRELLKKRSTVGAESSARHETDEFTIHSGVFMGKTCGTPICITIKNNDTRSKDYSETRSLARPSHADFTAHTKYKGFEDFRGGGHFSGRITAALCAVGAILISALNKKGILIGTHIKSCAGVSDREFNDISADISELNSKQFATLDIGAEAKIREEILKAKSDCDSVGGILETAIVGLPVGVGEPFFDSVESVISHAVFSIPGVKGIEFGAGFDITNKRGSQVNDELEIQGGKVITTTNNAGGINGGITNGMPVVFRTAIRPTPTIAKEQNTVDFEKMQNTTIAAKGRHDPCIVHRARAVQDAVTAIALADLLATYYSWDWLGE